MKNVNVKFAEDAREKIIDGVNLITDAIQVSYGPDGRQVALNINDSVTITKDGSTIAAAVNDPDPYVSIGINLIREISKKTSDEVGDGSTTVAVLAREIVNTFKNNERPIQTSRYVEKLADELIDSVREKKIEIKDKKDIFKVASLSANNNREIGELIADAYDSVGKDGLVTFEEANNTVDSVEYTNGFRIESGYASPYFINTSKNTCELENVFVWISDVKIDEVKQVMEVCEQVLKNKQSLLIIAPGFESECLIFLRANLELVKSCCVISPSFRNYRTILVDDMRDVIGNTCICQKVVCNDRFTTFIGCQSNGPSIDMKVSMIKALIKDGNLNEYDLNFQKKRLAIFTGGIATIKVGGYSQAEIKSKMALYEDAINSTSQAIKDGVVPGGGKALEYAVSLIEDCNETGSDFYHAVLAPVRLLHTENITWDQMLEKGILEPFSTFETTLRNAVSIASQIISCDCAIINNLNV